jgi:bla regulator protein blaR1
MIPHAPLSIWQSCSSAIAAIGAPLANHLWQSTLFAVVAGLLTLALRRNRAESRYWLWLAASLKFLIPFSVLVALGSHLGWTKSAAVVQPNLSVSIQQIGAPFGTAPSHNAFVSPVTLSPSHALPIVVVVIWALGCVAVLLTWSVRWLRLAGTVRQGVQLTYGREVQILGRIACGARPPRLPIIATSSALEPGVVGIFRPVLLLPEGIADRLTDAQLESIFAHELCHVRRRDNLAAAIHMLVEAVFWFHPLVWWMGARLIDERERACDEAVLTFGGDPQSYAEGILKVCEFYLESPLVCAAGVTGSNLKKRIEAIMIPRSSSKLNFGRKLLLSVACAAALLIPIAVGLLNPVSSRAQDTTSAVDSSSVSITPDTQANGFVSMRRNVRTGGPAEFAAANITLARLISQAYGVQYFQVAGGPDWVYSAKYDLTMKGAKSDAQVNAELQQSLVDHFKLAIHHETKFLPTYDLVIGPGGSKLTQVAQSNVPSPSNVLQPRIMLGPGHVEGSEVSMQQLAGLLSSESGHLVVDKTGLTGLYDFTLDWALPASMEKMREDTMISRSTSDPSAGLPTPFTAALPGEGNLDLSTPGLLDKLGLAANQTTGPVDTIVIDYAEQPAVTP